MPFDFDKILEALKNAIEANTGTKEDWIVGTKNAVAHDLESDGFSYAMAALVAALAAAKNNPNWSKDKLQEFSHLTVKILAEHAEMFDEFYDKILAPEKNDEKPAETAQNADLKAALKSIADLF